MPRLLWMAVGELVVWTALLDVFMTILYARVGTSLIVGRVASVAWSAFRRVARATGRWHDPVLSFAGPIIVLLLLTTWSMLLTIGTAMVIYPNLGHGVTNTSGPTSTDFITAWYAGGISLSMVGSSNYAPQTIGWRLYYLFNSLTGVSVASLTITYLMQVYTGLQRRAGIAIQAHLSSGETGDAAELVAGLGPQGKFTAGYNRLGELANELTALLEAYNLYPILVYFRYSEPQHALARVTLLTMDAVSLIKTGIDDRQFTWLKESGGVDELWRASMKVMQTIAEVFVPHMHGGGEAPPPDAATRARWTRRYDAALERFRAAGIPTIADPRAGADAYVQLRQQWDRYIVGLARYMGYQYDAIDPAACHTADVRQRAPFSTRLRSVR